MDVASSEYEFLDLTDINEEERSSLTSALFAARPQQPPAPLVNWTTSEKSEPQVCWTDTNYDLSSCSSGTPGPPTASSSLDSLPTTERDMAPHSPQRNAPTHTTAPPSAPPPPQLAYSQPPPPMYNAAPPNHWPQHLLPPNVYVSQVTANVNVHGYMGQYYHHQPQYVPHPPPEPRSRDSRDRNKGRRGGGVKRAQSPSFVYYQQIYPTPQTAQGAPLYHMPMYHPMGYVTGYPIVPFVDYAMIEDPNNPGEKGPEEYAPDMMMEQEPVAHEVVYSHPGCLPPPQIYDPNRLYEAPCSLEGPYPQFYQLPPPAPPVHQFNVHAKNFVRQEYKNYSPPQEAQKPQEFTNQAKSNNNNNASNNNAAVIETLPIKDLKISPTKTNQTSKAITIDKPLLSNPPAVQKNTTIIEKTDKTVPKPVVTSEVQKPAWVPNNVKSGDVRSPPAVLQSVANTQVSSAPIVTKPATSVPNKISPTLIQNKIAKNTTPVPFVNKSFIKNGPPQQMGAVILPQQGLPSKAPFSNKLKKEGLPKPQDIAETNDSGTANVVSSSTVVTEPKNPAAKPIVPVAIPVLNQTSNLITTKAAFSQARKSSITSAETPVPTPVITPPQAPTASDFPPPPGARRPVEQTPTNIPAPQPPVPSGKTWASLFDNRTPASSQGDDSNSSSQSTTNTVSTSSANQRPIAKVGPFDSSPLLHENIGKDNQSAAEKVGTHAQKNAVNKDKSDGSHVSPSIQINDPNAYRMGEFLSKYQLNHHTVSLQPRGLCNRSNYCYINAILQALIACPPFYNMLKNLPYHLKKGKSSTPIIDAMVELCCEFSPLPPGARVTRPERVARASPAAGTTGDAEAVSTAPPVNVGPPFEPSTVLHMLRDMNNGDSFRIEGRQEDAEEFLGCLLNGLNDEMLELIKLIDPDDTKDTPVVNGNETIAESEDDDEWKVMGPKNKGSIERRCLAGRTPLSDIFRGQLRSRLQRSSDNSSSDTTHCVQPFFTLPLDIERSNSVREALERVAGRDRLEGVTCPSRGRPVEAWQQVLLEQLPAVLLLHLKCFHSRPSDGATIKIVKNIDYPVDLKIDPKIISPKMKYSTKQRSYKLFAVVYHEGSEAEKGHYLTDVYHVGCGGWLRYDDSVVTLVTEQQVLHPRLPRTPYLLLYRRQDTMQTARNAQSTS